MPPKPPLGGVLEALTSLVDAVVCESLERNAGRFTTNQTGPALMGRREAADYLAVSGGTLDQLRKSGDIKTVKIGSVSKYPRTELDKYIRKLLMKPR